MRTKIFRSFVILAMLLAVVVQSALADNGVNTTALRNAVKVEAIRAHQAAFQAIADSNGGVRVAGSAGHFASAAYVEAMLQGAGYHVTKQTFQFPFFDQLAAPVFEKISPTSTSYIADTDFATMEYSGSGDVTAQIQPTIDVIIPPGAAASTSNSGCEAADFVNFVPGNIALIQRGTCTFAAKVQNAMAAGASGVIIFNEGQPGRTDLLNGTLGQPVNIPVVGATFDLGSELYLLSQSGPVTAHLSTSTLNEIRTTENVIAQTAGGRSDRVVVVGAHLDSVTQGPGIQDNGSGSATILEIALQMKALNIQPKNQVRFIWFSGEEEGLLGSDYYVSQLTARQIKDISVMLNFDMIGSPNYVRFVYDGDGSSTGVAGPNGSKVIEDVFNSYFTSQNLPVEPTAFDGRSDYGPFTEVGIPSGGLFTGAEEIKTASQAATYGGTAGLAFDPCYHQACDNYDNISLTALDQMSDAAVHAILTFASTTSSVNGTDKGKGNGSSTFEYLGASLQK